MAYQTKSSDILEAEIHALHIVQLTQLRLIREEKATPGELAHALKGLLDKRGLQQERLSKEGFAHYTEVLQRMYDTLRPPFQ